MIISNELRRIAEEKQRVYNLHKDRLNEAYGLFDVVSREYYNRPHGSQSPVLAELKAPDPLGFLEKAENKLLLTMENQK